MDNESVDGEEVTAFFALHKRKHEILIRSIKRDILKIKMSTYAA